jgi:dCMP deaminase
LNNRELKYKVIIHGERNAILFSREPLIGHTLYTWPFMPCTVCAAMVIQAGITRAVAPNSDNPRWQDDFNISKGLFKEAGVKLDLVDMKYLKKE